MSLALAAVKLAAHEFTITPVTIVISGEGSFQADVGLDADALALGLPLEADSEDVALGMSRLSEEAFSAAVETARAAVSSDIRILFDAAPVPFDVAFPHHGTAAATEADPPTVLGTVARLRGMVPTGSREVSISRPAPVQDRFAPGPCAALPGAVCGSPRAR